MKINIPVTVAFSVVALLFTLSLECLAEENDNMLIFDNDMAGGAITSTASIMNTLPIKPGLLSLMDLLAKTQVSSSKIEKKLKQLSPFKAKFNQAEQYLYLVAQALIITKLPKMELLDVGDGNVVSLLKKADKLSIHISDIQLSQPEFLQLHLILAEQYSQQGKYDLAYHEKTSYLERYHLYRKGKRLLMISSIEKSFELKNKKASNDLLRSQNALKERQVAEVKVERETQYYNFTIIISTAIIFVLLFFRQLKVRNKLIKLTRIDPLTQIPNRSALFEKGKRLATKFSKSSQDLSVLLLDLDHFKKINDNFGHAVGDKVLIIVSELIQETMRSRDFFARLGGEEFVALLPYADTHKAKAIAMRINEKIEAYDFSSIMIQKRITISIGIVTLLSNKMLFDDLLHCADLAMYQAKERGRNAVVCYEQISLSQDRRAQVKAS